jgi:hypothetical protein
VWDNNFKEQSLFSADNAIRVDREIESIFQVKPAQEGSCNTTLQNGVINNI